MKSSGMRLLLSHSLLFPSAPAYKGEKKWSGSDSPSTSSKKEEFGT